MEMCKGNGNGKEWLVDKQFLFYVKMLYILSASLFLSQTSPDCPGYISCSRNAIFVIVASRIGNECIPGTSIDAYSCAIGQCRH